MLTCGYFGSSGAAGHHRRLRGRESSLAGGHGFCMRNVASGDEHQALPGQHRTVGVLIWSPHNRRSLLKLGIYQSSAYDVQLMIDERFDIFDKVKCVREPDVPLKRCVICPLGMNEI